VTGDVSSARILLPRHDMNPIRIFAALAVAAALGAAGAQAQAMAAPPRPGAAGGARGPAPPRGDTARHDWATGLVRLPSGVAAAPEDAAMRAAAFRAGGRRVVVSLAERRLWYMDGRDTVFTAPVAVGKGTSLEYGSRAWRFNTPRGIRRVQSKRPNPVWTPPEWHYAELARDSGWALAPLERGRPARLRDGGTLLVRGEWIVYRHAGGGEEIIPADEEVIFDRTLFVPPTDTRNRRIEGELGAYALSMGDGYLLHGTPHKESIGQAATHGCIRLGDEAIEYLYRNVAVGTPVYIF
jgi:hypothetical protein